MNEDVTTEVTGILYGMPYDKMFEQIRLVYDTNCIAPALNANSGGFHEIKILVYETTDTTKLN